jgi:hypothetical protein
VFSPAEAVYGVQPALPGHFLAAVVVGTAVAIAAIVAFAIAVVPAQPTGLTQQEAPTTNYTHIPVSDPATLPEDLLH